MLFLNFLYYIFMYHFPVFLISAFSPSLFSFGLYNEWGRLFIWSRRPWADRNRKRGWKSTCKHVQNLHRYRRVLHPSSLMTHTRFPIPKMFANHPYQDSFANDTWEGYIANNPCEGFARLRLSLIRPIPTVFHAAFLCVTARCAGLDVDDGVTLA